MENGLETTDSSLLVTRESRRSGRNIKVPDWFMFLGEVVFDEYDLDPSNYNEVIFDKDSKNWQYAMEVEDAVYMMEPYSFIAKGQEHIQVA